MKNRRMFLEAAGLWSVGGGGRSSVTLLIFRLYPIGDLGEKVECYITVHSQAGNEKAKMKRIG